MNLSNIHPVRPEMPPAPRARNGFHQMNIDPSRYKRRPNALRVRQLMNEHSLTQMDIARIMEMNLMTFKNKILVTRKLDFPLSELKLLEVELGKRGAVL